MFSWPSVLLLQPARDQAERVWFVPCMKEGAEGLLVASGVGVVVARRGRRRVRRERGVYIVGVGMLAFDLGIRVCLEFRKRCNEI